MHIIKRILILTLLLGVVYKSEAAVTSNFINLGYGQSYVKNDIYNTKLIELGFGYNFFNIFKASFDLNHYYSAKGYTNDILNKTHIIDDSYLDSNKFSYLFNLVTTTVLLNLELDLLQIPTFNKQYLGWFVGAGMGPAVSSVQNFIKNEAILTRKTDYTYNLIYKLSMGFYYNINNNHDFFIKYNFTNFSDSLVSRLRLINVETKDTSKLHIARINHEIVFGIREYYGSNSLVFSEEEINSEITQKNNFINITFGMSRGGGTSYANFEKDKLNNYSNKKISNNSNVVRLGYGWILRDDLRTLLKVSVYDKIRGFDYDVNTIKHSNLVFLDIIDANNYLYSKNLKVYDVMFNIEYDLFKIKNLAMFLGAGMGVSLNTYQYGYSYENSLNKEIETGGKEKIAYTFPYTLSAGFSYDLGSAVTIVFKYSYVYKDNLEVFNLNLKPKEGIADTIKNSYYIRQNLQALNLSLRYKF